MGVQTMAPHMYPCPGVETSRTCFCTNYFFHQERGHVVKAFIILTPGYQAKVLNNPEERGRLVKDIQVGNPHTDQPTRTLELFGLLD